ncbi:MAG: hypothetical protein V3S43_06400 [Acidimicrobiia bacterium]
MPPREFTPEERDEFAALRGLIEEIQLEQRDIVTIADGMDKSLVLEPELGYATGIINDLPPTLWDRPGASPLRSVAKTIDWRLRMREAAEQDDTGVLAGTFRSLEAIKDKGIAAVIDTGTGLAELVTTLANHRNNPLAFLQQSLTGVSHHEQRRRIQQQFNDTRERMKSSLGVAPIEESETMALNRRIVHESIHGPDALPSGALTDLGGELAALIAISIASGGLAAPGGVGSALSAIGRVGGLGRVAGGAEIATLNLAARQGAGVAAARSLAGPAAAGFTPRVLTPGIGAAATNIGRTIVESQAGVLSRTLGPGINVFGKQLGPRGAFATMAAIDLVGAGVGLAMAPEDADAMQKAHNAIAGAGIFHLGAAAIIGRPYGDVARLFALEEARLAPVVAAQAQATMRAIGRSATIGSPANFGMIPALERATLRFTNIVARSPRTTVGHLTGAGAIGASYAVGRAISDGASMGDAIVAGVKEGGGWIGADITMAGVVGAATMTKFQALWTENVTNYFLAAGLGENFARNIGGTAPTLGRGALGAAGGAAIGEATADSPIIGALAGATLGAGFLGIARTRLHSMLPKDTLIKLIDGRIGALSTDEGAMIAETILSSAAGEVAHAAKDPVLKAMMRHLVGTPGMGRVPITDPGRLLVAPRGRGTAVKDATVGPPRVFVAHGATPVSDPTRLIATPPRPGEPVRTTFGQQPEVASLATLRTRLGNVDRSIAERTAELRRKKRSVKGDRRLEAARADRRQILDDVEALRRSPAAFNIPAAVNSTVNERVAAIKSRQASIIQELNQLEKRGTPPFAARVINLAREYANLRDDFASILNRGGIESAAAERFAREGFSILPPGTGDALRRAGRTITVESEAIAAVDARLSDPATLSQLRGLTTGRRKPALGPTPARSTTGSVPSGDILATTPQAVSAAPLDLPTARARARQAGLEFVIEDGTAGRVYSLRTSDGQTIVSSNGMQNTFNELEAILHQRRIAGEGGFTTTQTAEGLVGGAGGALLGGFVAAQIERALSDSDRASVPGITAGAIVGAIAGPLLLSRLSGRLLSREAQQVLKIVKPKIVNPVSRADVGTNLGTGSVNLGTFARMEGELQNAHVAARITNIAGQQNKDILSRSVQLEKFMRQFTPNDVPSQDVENAFFAAAKKLDVDEFDALTTWRGFLENVTRVPGARRGGKNAPTLHDLGRRPTGAGLATAAGRDELRRIVEAAELMSGPPNITAGQNFQRFQDAIRQSRHLSAKAKQLREWAVNQDREAGALAETGVPVGTLSRTLSGVRAMESIRRDAQMLLDRGDPDGEIVNRMYGVIAGATDDIRKSVDFDTTRLAAIFDHLNMEDRRLVNLVMQGGRGTVDGVERTASEWRAILQPRNERIVQAADQFRGILDEWIDRLEVAAGGKLLPRGQRIVDYLPWIYSQRSLRELRRTGLIDDEPMAMAMGYGMPETRWWGHLEARMGDSPIGEILTDPMEIGRIYITGAARKLHLENMLAQLPEGTITDLARRQPFMAQDIARWVMDLHGIPSKGHIKAASFLKSVGIGVERFSGIFNETEFTRAIVDRYYSMADPQRISGFARGFEFMSKIGFNYISPMVNATQTIVNTGTDLSFLSILTGAKRWGQGAIADRFETLAPFIDRNAAGRDVVTAMTETGVFSSTFTHDIMEGTAGLFSHSRVPTARPVVGAILGAIGGAVVPPPSETGAGRAAQAVIGAGIGAGVGSRFPRAIAASLRLVKAVAVGPFEAVEFMNRGLAASGARVEALRAQALKATGRTGRVGDIAESTLVGAGAGGATGAVFDREDPLRGATVGAAGGAAIGLGLGGIAEPRATRVLRELSRRPEVQQAIKDAIPNEEQTLRWYMRQVTDQTQFRFGRAARGQHLRTPAGEAMASLQTYTLNQIEFTGGRWGSFVRSMDKGPGQIDARFFRHIMLVMGTGSMMTATFAALDNHRDPQYWINRIGWGFMPFVTYDERNGLWGILDPGEALLGPFIGDLTRVVGTFGRLISDPVARRNFDIQSDDLGEGVFSLLRQAQRIPDATANALATGRAEKLAEVVGASQLRQGLEDAARGLRGVGQRISRPVSTVRRGFPVPRGATRGSGEREAPF